MKNFNLDSLFLVLGAIASIVAMISLGFSGNTAAAQWAFVSLCWIGVSTIKNLQIKKLQKNIDNYEKSSGQN